MVKVDNGFAIESFNGHIEYVDRYDKAEKIFDAAAKKLSKKGKNGNWIRLYDAQGLRTIFSQKSA